MLLTLGLVGYAACSGATFMRFMQIYDLIDRPRAKVTWLFVSVAAAVLWPFTWAAFGVIAWLANRDARR